MKAFLLARGVRGVLVEDFIDGGGGVRGGEGAVSAIASFKEVREGGRKGEREGGRDGRREKGRKGGREGGRKGGMEGGKERRESRVRIHPWTSCLWNYAY